jgi:hypothetical protein
VLRIYGVGQGEHRARHHLVELGESIGADAVGFSHQADGPITVDNHDRTVRALGQQGKSIANRMGWAEGERGVEQQVPGLHPGRNLRHDVGRDVLGKDGQPAAPSDGLCHPTAGDRSHIGHYQGNHRAAAVAGGEVDVESGTDRGTGRHHEDVVVGEFEGLDRIKEAHNRKLSFRRLLGVSIAVFDIDGVVADVRHRLHYLAGRFKDWDGFFDSADEDPPLATGLALVEDLAGAHEIVWLTGRPEWLRELTTKWLGDHGLPVDELHMRPDHDWRPARLYKLDVLRRLQDRTVAAFIDDDDEVVDAALKAGFPAVLADWIPRAATMREVQDRLGRT